MSEPLRPIDAGRVREIFDSKFDFETPEQVTKGEVSSLSEELGKYADKSALDAVDELLHKHTLGQVEMAEGGREQLLAALNQTRCKPGSTVDVNSLEPEDVTPALVSTMSLSEKTALVERFLEGNVFDPKEDAILLTLKSLSRAQLSLFILEMEQSDKLGRLSSKMRGFGNQKAELQKLFADAFEHLTPKAAAVLLKTAGTHTLIPKLTVVSADVFLMNEHQRRHIRPELRRREQKLERQLHLAQSASVALEEQVDRAFQRAEDAEAWVDYNEREFNVASWYGLFATEGAVLAAYRLQGAKTEASRARLQAYRTDQAVRDELSDLNREQSSARIELRHAKLLLRLLDSVPQWQPARIAAVKAALE